MNLFYLFELPKIFMTATGNTGLYTLLEMFQPT